MIGSLRDRPAGEPPIIIFGAPRSGTTLLRTLLNAHPAIAAGPEAPWLAEHQPRSALGLARYLAEDPHGWTANFGGDREEALGAVRALVDHLMGAYVRRKGKRRWAHKTPNDILHIEPMLELFPDARIIWLLRGGLDVAMSTAITAEHRRGVSPLYEKQVKLGPGVAAPNTPVAAALRWGLWNHRVRRALAGRSHLLVRFEDLVRAPEPALRALCAFIGEDFDPAMLEYDAAQHDLPAWEWGSADVRHHGSIDARRAGRAQRDLTELQVRALAPLAAPTFLDAPASGEAPEDRPPDDEALRELAGALDTIAGALGARAIGADAASLADLRRAVTAAADATLNFPQPTLAPLVAGARGALPEGQFPPPVRQALAAAGLLQP